MLTLAGDAIGSAIVTVVATDDRYMEDANQEPTPPQPPGRDECSLSIPIPLFGALFTDQGDVEPLLVLESTIPINAGADRILAPSSIDFGGNEPFSIGAQLTSGTSGGSVPSLIAVANRGQSNRFTFRWEVVNVPGAADIVDVVILNRDASVAQYLIIPSLSNRVPAITRAGQLIHVSNTVVPGTYTFRVSLTDELCGDVFQDEVSHTLIPKFEVLGPAGP